MNSINKLARMIAKMDIHSKYDPFKMKLYVSTRKAKTLNKHSKCKENQLWVSISIGKETQTKKTIPNDADVIYEHVINRGYNVAKFFSENKNYIKNTHNQNFKISQRKLDLLLTVLKTEDKIQSEPISVIDPDKYLM